MSGLTGGLVADVRYPRGFYRRMSNGETESAKTMLVEDLESERAATPSKDGTLVIRQVRRKPSSAPLSKLLTASCFLFCPRTRFVSDSIFSDWPYFKVWRMNMTKGHMKTGVFSKYNIPPEFIATVYNGNWTALR